jgi:hypothetical protein
VTGEVERVQKLIYFFIFFTVEGEVGGSFFFFFPRCMKRWKKEGERGTFRVHGNVFFIVEWLGRGSPGVIFRVKFIMGQGFRVHWGKGCTLIYFFIVEGGRGVEVNVFFLPSFDMWKEEGKRKRMIFFLIFVFSLWSG